MCFFFSNGRKISAKSVTSLVLWMGLSRNDLIRAAPLPISKKDSRICVYICLNKSMSQKDLHFGFIFVWVLNLNLILNLEFTVELTQVFRYLLLIIIFLVHVLALQLSTSRLVTDAGISITEGRQKNHSGLKVLAIQRKITWMTFQRLLKCYKETSVKNR